MAEKPYTILCLDLATRVGWCFIEDAQYRCGGILQLPSHSENPGLFFLKFQNWLHAFRGVDEIFFEQVPRFESAAAAKVHCGLLSTMHIFRVSHGIKAQAIKPSALKKAFTGIGTADKTLMCKVAHALGWRGGHPDTDIDHDAADALAMGFVLLQRRGVELTFNNQMEMRP